MEGRAWLPASQGAHPQSSTSWLSPTVDLGTDLFSARGTEAPQGIIWGRFTLIWCGCWFSADLGAWFRSLHLYIHSLSPSHF